ncbi:MAG: SWIM zinc finger family protein, partial [Herbiconiux sp.]|nr:SWIM zinc finger family protein [Herbiconiux sp.]
MSSRWTAEQVIGLAPDASSVAAGRKLASPAAWSGTGCTPTAVWGSAKGSGKTPYQVAVDLSGPAYKCSCPSRKIPCKHVLGLLLQWADGAVGDGEPAAYVEEWLVARSERAEAAQVRVERRVESESDPAARAARQSKRATKISAGLADLDGFLGDLVGKGLAAARERPVQVWEEQARRLVDAQAPALADRVRALGSALHAGRQGWPLAALQEAAALHLTVRGWLRGDELPEDLRDDLRARIG